MNMAAYNNGGGVERRNNPHIREIFDEAYRIVYPLLKSHSETNGMTSHSMLHQTLHDAFPTLHKQDLPILEASLTRVFREQSRVTIQ
ncbi:MAG: hypothetical protein PHH36_11800 [Sideroxydans sp.]|nr:hypothetical protein [Sideroxydans sp.]